MSEIQFLRADTDISAIREILLDHIPKRAMLSTVAHSIEPYGPQEPRFAAIEGRRTRVITWLPKGILRLQ